MKKVKICIKDTLANEVILLKECWQEDEENFMVDFIGDACVDVLKEYPMLSSRLVADELVESDYNYEQNTFNTYEMHPHCKDEIEAAYYVNITGANKANVVIYEKGEL